VKSVIQKMDENNRFPLPKKFISSVIPPGELIEPGWWFAFRGNSLLVCLNGSSASLPFLVDLRELGLPIVRRQYLGVLDGLHCYSAELEEDSEPPAEMAFQDLRQLFGQMDEDLFGLAGRAVQIVDWDRTHQFCGRCGVRTVTQPVDRAKECPRCGLINFPRLSPAIIVLVERGRELLMARSHHFPPGRYSVIAGFVEPGETLEQAVVREVKEEVDIDIKNIRYFGSQPWPFPNSLMVGFLAEYAGGDIRIDDREVEDARWFTVNNLPALPGKISISRRLIDWFIAKQARSA
jgi:NAD+ diphosphatase